MANPMSLQERLALMISLAHCTDTGDSWEQKKCDIPTKQNANINRRLLLKNGIVQKSNVDHDVITDDDSLLLEHSSIERRLKRHL